MTLHLQRRLAPETTNRDWSREVLKHVCKHKALTDLLHRIERIKRIFGEKLEHMCVRTKQVKYTLLVGVAGEFRLETLCQESAQKCPLEIYILLKSGDYFP